MTKKQKNFKQATKALFMKYTVVPIFILFVVFFIFTYYLMYWKAVQDAEKAAENILRQVNSVHQSYQNEILELADSELIKDFLDTRKYSNLIFEEFYNFNNEQVVKSVFYLTDENGKTILATNDGQNSINDYAFNRFLRYIQKNPDQIVMDASKTQYSHGKITALSIGKAVVENGEVKGCLIYQLYENDMLNVIFAENVDIAIVTDEFDNIIVTTNELARGIMNKFRPDIENDSNVIIKDEKYFLSQASTSDSQFKIYSLKALGNNQLSFVVYFGFTIITGFILYFLVRILAEKMASKNVQSINQLVSAVQRLQKGDMDAYVDVNTGDEFEYLAKQYNIMVNNLDQLMKRNEELARIRRVSEIKLLQGQFNPHFLFNVLETLRYTMLVDTRQAQNIIMTLSKLLRYSLDSGTEEIPLVEDLVYTVDYLTLHKYRFNDRLHYEIHLPDEVKAAYVPKLILQPIIENAIKYGYRKKMKLTILIDGKVENDIIYLSVYDDGGGMEPERLAEIRKSLTNEENVSERIGLYNTNRRLKILYGAPYGLKIASTAGEGTEVELKFPYKRGKN